MKTRPLLTLICLFSLCTSLSGCLALVAGAATGSALVAHDRRTTGTIVDDRGIELKAYRALATVPQVREKGHVAAVSYNNNLLLVGQVPNAATRDAIERAVRNETKIDRIFNELEIAPVTALGARSNDTWITTRVKSEMMVSSLDPTRIKVLTENGVVYLMGIVHAQEADDAVSLARRIRGVQKVVKMFEYLDEDLNLNDLYTNVG